MQKSAAELILDVPLARILRTLWIIQRPIGVRELARHSKSPTSTTQSVVIKLIKAGGVYTKGSGQSRKIYLSKSYREDPFISSLAKTIESEQIKNRAPTFTRGAKKAIEWIQDGLLLTKRSKKT